MELTTSTLALFMTLTCHSIGSAQTVQKKDLTLDGAKKVIAAAMAETRNKNAPGGVIAVVDEGGNLIAGAITSRIILWDAGIGPNPGPRQRHPTLEKPRTASCATPRMQIRQRLYERIQCYARDH